MEYKLYALDWVVGVIHAIKIYSLCTFIACASVCRLYIDFLLLGAHTDPPENSKALVPAVEPRDDREGTTNGKLLSSRGLTTGSRKE